MTTAADELADLFESWSMDSEEPLSARIRAHAGDPSEGFLAPIWVAHARAMALLDQIRRDVAAMADTGRSVDYLGSGLDSWYRGILSVDKHWQGQAYSGEVISQADMAVLRSIGLATSYIERVSISPTAQHDLAETLQAAKALLADAENGLSDVERVYVLTLLNAAQGFVEESAVVDSADLRAHLERLNGALLGVSAVLGNGGNGEAGRKVAALALHLASIGAGILNTAAALSTIFGVDAGDVFKPLGT